MELSDKEMQLAAYIFDKISQDLRNVRKGGRQYWELVSLMQELSNRGSVDAAHFMQNIDLSRAPEFSSKTWTTRMQEGPKTTSFRGARRQLQADPHSPHKTFGMRPHHDRGGPDDPVEL